MLIDRRQFVTWSAGGAFLLGLGVGAAAADEAPAISPGLSPWIRIAPDGRVTLYSTVSEMGQGARTGQAQVLADELDVAWEAISVEMAPDAAPFNAGFGIGTGGSASIRGRRWSQMRAAGATARAQLVTAAAKRWNCPESECAAALGTVKHTPSGRSFGYGALAGEAATCAAPAQPPLKDRSQWRYIGKPLPTLENADKSTGRAIYGIDVRLPGLLRASISAAPVFGAKLASVDEAPAMATPGVRKVVKLDNAVAVIADTTFAAFKGLRALKPEWSTPATASTSGEIEKKLEASFDAPSAAVEHPDDRQALRTAFDAAPRKVEAVYQTAFLAHAALEPMNTTVQVTADKVEIWSPTQTPTRLKKAVAKALGRPVEQVVLHVTLLGGGYGRRLQADYALQAAQVAAEAGGAPVQLVWTREEDVGHDFYRKAVRSRYRAALGPDGMIGGYEVVSASAQDATRDDDPAPYAKMAFASTRVGVDLGIPCGPWRSVDPGISAFGRESFVDECAHAAKLDPLEYRRRLIGDDARVRRLIDAAAEAIGWGKPKAAGVGRGLALIKAFESLVATGVEVEAKGKALKVTRIVVAGDVGTTVNPQQVKAQFEGGAVMGLSAALGESVTFTAGKADQANFNAYKLIRMNQAPAVEVRLFESPDAPVGGAGEPGVPGVAPALANAVFDATGKRIRMLPFSAQGFTV
jgi:isoquinoline 1-oxidoreductase beta subunit